MKLEWDVLGEQGRGSQGTVRPLPGSAPSSRLAPVQAGPVGGRETSPHSSHKHCLGFL